MRARKPDSKVADIVSTARRLREVRQASRQFLLLWGFERTRRRNAVLPTDLDIALSDPQNHDWSLLYQGSVLDD